MKIDIFSHITTPKYRQAQSKYVQESAMSTRIIEGQYTLWNLEERFRIMDRYEDYQQVICLVGSPIETIVKGKAAVEMAQLANDELANLVAKHPDRFLCGVANLPFNDTEAALIELDRAVNDLKLKGVFIHTPLYFYDEKTKPPAGGKGLDSPELFPIYEAMAKYDLPIFIHPNALYDIHMPDYTSEKVAKHMAWQIFGWVYQDTLAQVRLIFSGVFDKFPNLKFINHHAGAMVPFFTKRISAMYNMFEMRGGMDVKKGLPQAPLEYFRKFYNDTAVNGNTHALMCAYGFYGAEHMVFGTDMPFDMELGREAIRETIRSIEEMDISADEKKAIFSGNARKMFHF
ncbi:MAG: amidohydrolase family protein [Desulfobacterales bacterium]|nr:amidohydrolase family protein [Desulfobacterales bacterium]